jgi:D-alanyl-D-alanine carboxypeptidase/D-alanyl-D-alanine-endopeptidase (penicillin-binding protein 4)
VNRSLSLAAALAVVLGSPLALGTPAAPGSTRLVWHVETLDGDIVDSREGDRAINPASVVKVATSLWALERLGADHRFETRFSARGTLDPAAVTLDGDLVVHGAGDLDFQVENAFLVADALSRLGIGRVTGRLVVDGRFWIGWEGGSARAARDPALRGTRMAGRLREALDPHRWTRRTRAAWARSAVTLGLDPRHPARVAVESGIAVEQVPPEELRPVVVHRSNPLIRSLFKFNCFSNNDIERLDATAGPPGELAAWLASRIGAPADSLAIETSSGLGTNRISPRDVVRLLRELRRTTDRLGERVDSVLPVAGCGPCTVSRTYPRLAAWPMATAVVAKTGTLTTTDGGVAVLAGYARTATGELLFCVAAPGSGRQLARARREQEEWLLGLISSRGGPAPGDCPPPGVGPAERARIVGADPQSPLPEGTD